MFPAETSAAWTRTATARSTAGSKTWSSEEERTFTQPRSNSSSTHTPKSRRHRWAQAASDKRACRHHVLFLYLWRKRGPFLSPRSNMSLCFCSPGGRSSGCPYGWRGLRLHQAGGRTGVHCRGNQSLLQGPGEAQRTLNGQSFAAVIVSAHRLLLLIPDFPLQGPSIRTFCHQLPAHHHRKGTYSNPKLTYPYKKYKWQTNKVYFTVSCIQTRADV